MEFYAGSEHTARAVMLNPTDTAFDYLGVLFMGISQATMVEVSFHLEAGESKEIVFPVTMPTALGDYPVYLGVFSGGVFLEPLRQGENITIVAQAAAVFSMPAQMRTELEDGSILGMYWNCKAWLDVTNNGSASGSQVVHIWDSVLNVDSYVTVTLGPGETYTWHRTQWVDFRRLSSYKVWAQGDWVGNNQSVAEFP